MHIGVSVQLNLKLENWLRKPKTAIGIGISPPCTQSQFNWKLCVRHTHTLVLACALKTKSLGHFYLLCFYDLVCNWGHNSCAEAVFQTFSVHLHSSKVCIDTVYCTSCQFIQNNGSAHLEWSCHSHLLPEEWNTQFGNFSQIIYMLFESCLSNTCLQLLHKQCVFYFCLQHIERSWQIHFKAFTKAS